MDGHLAELVGHLYRAWPILVLLLGWIFRVEMLLKDAMTREEHKDAMRVRDDMLEHRYVPREALGERLKAIEEKVEEVKRLVQKL